MDVSTAVSAITIVGQIAGTEVLKEATKDAYRRFKDVLAEVFGSRGARMIERLENDPTSLEAKTELEAILIAPAREDEPDLQNALQMLLALLADDPAAKRAAAAAHIKLDIESGGHVAIEGVEGARNIDVKSKSTGNFDFRQIQMDTGRDRGN